MIPRKGARVLVPGVGEGVVEYTVAGYVCVRVGPVRYYVSPENLGQGPLLPR